MIALYALVKFVAYGVWCYLGLRLVQPAGATAASALWLGTIRWFIGLFFGIAVFFLIGSIDAEAAARTYFRVYSPLRAVEWGIMAVFLAGRLPRGSLRGAGVRLTFWCLGGILVSFLTDLLSPEGLQGRFCVGRCLC